jgi:hypothetical protein
VTGYPTHFRSIRGFSKEDYDTHCMYALDRILKRALDGDASFGFLIRGRDGRQLPVLRITDLDFADDIALVAESFETAQAMLDAVNTEASLAGLRINLVKTKVLVRGDLERAEPIRSLLLNGSQLERVTDFKYLGSLAASVEGDINARSASAAAAVGQLQEIWRSPLPRKTKARIFKSTVEPILFYGCESWALTGALTTKVVGKWFRLLRWATRTPWREKRTNASLLGELGLRHPKQVLRERFLGLIGHAIRGSTRSYPVINAIPPLQLTFMVWRSDGYSRVPIQHPGSSTRLTMRRGQGHRYTIERHCKSLIGQHAKDFSEVVALALDRTLWHEESKRNTV